jgi:hypothetical protein
MGSVHRMWFSAAAVAATAVASMIMASSASAFASGGNPCGLISSTQIESALGLTHSDQTPEIRPGGPDGAVSYARCDFAVWSGGIPKTRQQAVKKIKNGTGASVVIETWVPSPGPNVASWDLMGYGPRVDDEVRGCKELEKHHHGRGVSLPLDGAQGSFGAEGVAFGLNICGVWHRDDSDRIISINIKETQHRNAVKDLKKIAKIMVSQFW